MKIIIQKFWAWYERNLTLNIAIVALLFTWQLVHLYWLTTDVVTVRLFGVSFFNPTGVIEFLIIIADYVEIPAIIGASLLYISLLRKGFSIKSIAMLVFVNSQWLHIFWITDEFIIGQFAGGSPILPLWLAWVAIGVDYLELPVIYDTLKRFFTSISPKRIR
ncbi:MAG: hypothetical protein KJI72_01900 [Patescibacteria group bacterium]|nr:hypothetical protein [Patescibacteria group bacterium]